MHPSHFNCYLAFFICLSCKCRFKLSNCGDIWISVDNDLFTIHNCILYAPVEAKTRDSPQKRSESIGILASV